MSSCKIYLLRALLLTAALVLLAAPGAAAQEAENLTAQCAFHARSKYKPARMYDGEYTTYWLSYDEKSPSVEITVPEGKAAYGLYICFGTMPGAWEIQAPDGQGTWTAVAQGDTRYLHVYVPLDGLSRFRLIETSGRKTQMKINELTVFGPGELPDWVQRWEPTPEKADLLVLSAHPDDELIFFGGTIPTYATERGKRVVVAYMTPSNTTRSSELLNGLWHMGLRTYPVIGPFSDSYSRTLKEAYELWRKKEVNAFVSGLIRRYRPEVMVTHDVNGEYGHGAHRLCADAALRCVEGCMDETFSPESAQSDGVWQVKKLYLHLYPENSIEMNWRVPLASMEGKTGLELAQEAYAFHVTQQRTRFVVEDSGETSCARFGLAYTTVGKDQAGGDFFENIPEDAQKESGR